MNVHPLFVHFPVALLFLYSLIKILPLERYFPNIAWKHIRRIFLLIGVLGAFAALGTGEIAEQLATDKNKVLIETHSMFANITTWVYVLIVLGEASALVNSYGVFNKMRKVTLWLEKVLENRIVSVLLALIGFVLISLTGMLGGVVAYGSHADPVARYVAQLFGFTF